MAKGYRPVSRDQPYLLPPDMRDWLAPGHPVWLVISVVGDHLDTSAFHAGRKTGGAGAAGYDPDMLVMVLVWAYAHQVTSSRRIGQLCGTDVAFRVICGGNTPDHVTIARFRAEFAGAVAVFFAQVLALCARLGMGKLGVVALDGMKIAASASKPANRAGEHLAKLAAGTVARHAETDAAEDGLFGPGVAGDEVPGGAWSPRRRGERIAAALAKLGAWLARAAAQPDTGRAEPVRNITDPGARLMPVRGGTFIQGCNTQNVTTHDGLIIATTLTADPTDTAWFEPMLHAAQHAATLITAHRPPPPASTQPAAHTPAPPSSDSDTGAGATATTIGLFLADAGYLSEHNLTTPGPDRLIATGKTRNLEKAARDRGDPATAPGASQAIAAMAARLATPDGITACRQRAHIAETPHGQIKHNMRFRQLSVRGKPKATAEWTFTTAVHNLFKAITTGHLTQATQATLPTQAPQPATPA
jgi:transposase